MKLRHTPLIILAAMLATAAVSCGSSADGDDSDFAGADTTITHPTDLALYELNGHPRRVSRVTYYDVQRGDDGTYRIADSTLMQQSTIRFEPSGQYMPKEGERVKRDKQGRIVRWENHHPVSKGTPIAFSKDTLEFRYIDANHMVSDGMGQYAVIVYDDQHRVTGQYTVSRLNHINTSAYNVYLDQDKQGNWTRRLTIWTTQGRSDSLPAVHYSLDTREILYYKK